MRRQKGLDLKHQVLFSLEKNREVPLMENDFLICLQKIEMKALTISKYFNSTITRKKINMLVQRDLTTGRLTLPSDLIFIDLIISNDMVFGDSI